MKLGLKVVMVTSKKIVMVTSKKWFSYYNWLVHFESTLQVFIGLEV
jgi:hypothetical protein